MKTEQFEPKSIRVEGMTQEEVDFLFIESANCISKFCTHMLFDKRLPDILENMKMSFDDFILNSYKLKVISELNGGQ